jgi:photosystem II stability/assembly factor-like uncharacterized protein
MIRILFSMLGLLICINGFSQWQEINTPRGIKVNGFSTQNDNLYACTSGGIYKYFSSSWSKLGDDFNSNVTGLIENSSYLFTGTSTEGVYRSSDNGNTWLQVNNNLTNTNVREIHIYKSFIFVGTTNGLFSSNNNGIQWTDKSSNLGNKNISTILVFNDSLILGTQNGIYMSADTAKSWAAKSSGLSSKNITDIIAINNNLFASTSDGGVFLSIDSSETWSIANSGLNTLSVNQLYFLNDTLFAGTSDSLYFTTSLSELEWSSLPTKIPSEEILALSQQNGNLIIGNTYGAFQKDNESVSKNDGFPEWKINSLFTYDSLVFLLADKGIWELNESDREWYFCSYFPGNSVTEIMDYNDTTIIMYNSSGIYKSHDTLKTWIKISSNTKVTSIDTLNSYIFYGTSNSGVYRSNDLGGNWLPVNIGLVENNVIDIICSNEKIFIAVDKSEYGSKIYGSINNGDEWYQISDLVNWSAIIAKGIKLDTAILFQTDKMYYSINISTELMDTIKPEFIYQGSIFGIQNTLKINDAIVLGSRFKPLYSDAEGVGIYISMKACKNFVQINKGLPSSQYQYNPYGTVYTPIADLEYSSKSSDLFALLSDNKLMLRNINNIAVLSSPTNLAMSKDSIDYEHFRLNFEWQNHATNATDMILVETNNPHGGVSVGDLNFVKQISSTYDTTSLFMEQWSYEMDDYKASNYKIIACDSGDCSSASVPATDTVYSTSISKNVMNGNFNVSVFPNPVTNGYLYINLNDKSEYDISVYNSVGEIIFSKTIMGEEVVNLKSQPRGVYLLNVKNKATSLCKTIKIIAQ